MELRQGKSRMILNFLSRCTTLQVESRQLPNSYWHVQDRLNAVSFSLHPPLCASSFSALHHFATRLPFVINLIASFINHALSRRALCNLNRTGLLFLSTPRGTLARSLSNRIPIALSLSCATNYVRQAALGHARETISPMTEVGCSVTL